MSIIPPHVQARARAYGILIDALEGVPEVVPPAAVRPLAARLVGALADQDMLALPPTP